MPNKLRAAPNLLCPQFFCTSSDLLGLTLVALLIWLLGTTTHSIPCFTSTGIALSVNTISAGKKPLRDAKIFSCSHERFEDLRTGFLDTPLHYMGD